VCGIDPGLVLDSNKKIKSSPEMDRRITTYKKYHEGFGEILVQTNVEDTRLGVAEYVSSKHDLDTIELKWGQGAKCIGGEIKVNSIKRAVELKKRGYIVTPDPIDPAIKVTYKEGAIKEFERHSRLGFVTKEGFLEEVDRLRDLGFKRVTLKTGAYSMVEAAMALKYCSEAKIDLLTCDGAPGGTGMSPWPMMEEWGIPTFYFQSLMYEFAEKLSKKGMRVPDLAMAGGFSSEDGVYKAVFGPVAAISVFENMDEAVALANGTEFGLGASMWTKNLDTAMRMSSQLECGMVWVNEICTLHPQCPWVGVKNSGMGKDLSRYGIREFVSIKHVNINFENGKTRQWWFPYAKTVL
jgi:hypothetical protein